MKITGIHINDFQQFNDFHLDLTYPKGHEKEGKPLDKVCFIGQSGTGKTTILKIIDELLSSRQQVMQFTENDLQSIFHIDTSINSYFEIIGKFIYGIETPIKYFSMRDIEFSNKEYDSYLKKWKHTYIYFPSEIIEFQEKNKQTIDEDLFSNFFTTDETLQNKLLEEKDKFNRKRYFNFSKDNTNEIWKNILIDAREYMVNELIFSQKISKALVKNSNKSEDLLNEFKKWQNDNPNPFKVLAEVLNPIIERFNIKVRDDFDFEKPEDLDFIKLETKDRAIVPMNVWSTGTKQIVLTAIPIYKLDTTNTIILIDEPERSLYPDIQNEIIDYYTSLAITAQFFFATHSPIIASSFEPWEIIELKFDYTKGKVFQEKYYEGDRHIDNYFINPQYLRWDSILTKVFDLPEKGNEKRIEKLMELASLGKKIEKEEDKPKKAEFYKEYKKLAELLDWETK